mgnify:CR=1 FL=1
MCTELNLLDQVEQQYNYLLNTLIFSYSPVIEAAQYNRIFDACFNLAEFILIESNLDNDDDDLLEILSAHYVIETISDLMDEIDDVESIAYQMIVLLIQHALTQEGRLKNGMELIDDYFKSKYGMFDVVKQDTFYTNFMILIGN